MEKLKGLTMSMIFLTILDESSSQYLLTSLIWFNLFILTYVSNVFENYRLTIPAHYFQFLHIRYFNIPFL
ncbi:hypothetical protein DFO77_102122 [Marinilabilia salmonicolor]|jgi:hypothetical protein|uniref:Uncharacterized protein n=1 Tax=Marinilabilia salmonicolor TaxID=989 RepID=A0A2T0XIM5_9BACT|nr:hypothetical protein BY457_10939 [Marinilabilia salmonicolor]RCW38968.1 hypothetical protein DFO77_102122 [Marinilabilia salmonicolor]